MTSAYRRSLFAVLLCAAISIVWGSYGGHSKVAWLDFRAIYAGTRCLIHGHNPYSVSDLEREYSSEDGQRPSGPSWGTQSITLYVNMPTAFIFLAPFAALPWVPAHILWMLLTGFVFFGAVLLIWHAGARSSLEASTLLACILAANCELIFSGGNTGAIVVGFCVIAAWCLLSDRMVWLGVVCLGLSLAIKPHDSGFVWLYFVLAGGVYRKKAFQSLLVTAAVGAASILWLWHVAPHWLQDWRANLAAISMRGGINDPSPASITGHIAPPVIDLQAAISVFLDHPWFYNAATYLVCGALLLVWAVWALRSRFSRPRAWFGIAAAAALTILITYHRQWDAKLIMLAIVPCCRLWSERGMTGKIALWITAAAVFFTADVPLVFLDTLYDTYHLTNTGVAGHLLTLFLLRSASIALLAMGVFYLWICVMRGPDQQDSAMSAELTGASARASAARS
jgi:Glycosyltransferase family 87